MADEDVFDIGRDLPVFLASVLDKRNIFAKMMRAKGPKVMAKGFHHALWHLGTEQVQFLQDCLNYISETLFFLKSHLCIRE